MVFFSTFYFWAIRSFKGGVRRKELKEEFGRQKPKTIGEMMEIANRRADGEQSMRNDQGRLPKDDGDRSDRRKRRKTREAGGTVFVIAKLSKSRDGGYRGNRDWKPRPEEKPINQQLDEYCSIHAYRNKETGRLKANHTLRNCRNMQVISQALTQNQQQAINQGYPKTPRGGAIAYGAPAPPAGQPMNSMAAQ